MGSSQTTPRAEVNSLCQSHRSTSRTGNRTPNVRFVDHRLTRAGSVPLIIGLGAGSAAWIHSATVTALLIVAGVYCVFSIKVANQWESAPCFVSKDSVECDASISKYVDQRVRVTDVRAETALTADTVIGDN